MARKAQGEGDVGLARYVRLYYPQLEAEAKDYWAAHSRTMAERARAKKYEMEATAIREKISALQAKLAKVAAAPVPDPLVPRTSNPNGVEFNRLAAAIR